MTRTVRALQVRFVQMGVECLSVREKSHAVLLIQLSNCQRRSVSSLYFLLRMYSRGDYLMEKLSGTVGLICVAFWRKDNIPVC